MTHKTWWHTEGSAMRPLPNEDIEEFAKRITEIAWANGAYESYPDGVDAVWVARRTLYAVEQEREACAEICKEHADVYGAFEPTPSFQAAWAACIDLRDKIRARGKAWTS